MNKQTRKFSQAKSLVMRPIYRSKVEKAKKGKRAYNRKKKLDWRNY